MEVCPLRVLLPQWAKASSNDIGAPTVRAEVVEIIGELHRLVVLLRPLCLDQHLNLTPEYLLPVGKAVKIPRPGGLFMRPGALAQRLIAVLSANGVTPPARPQPRAIPLLCAGWRREPGLADLPVETTEELSANARFAVCGQP